MLKKLSLKDFPQETQMLLRSAIKSEIAREQKWAEQYEENSWQFESGRAAIKQLEDLLKDLDL